MADSRLKDFYRRIAFGEFEQALKLATGEKILDEEPERIVIQALKLKEILRKNYLPE
jgi:hypothetical protein